MFLLQKLSSSLRLADVRIALYDIGEEFAVAIYHAMHVVYLFTKTDIMTTLIPNVSLSHTPSLSVLKWPNTAFFRRHLELLRPATFIQDACFRGSHGCGFIASNSVSPTKASIPQRTRRTIHGVPFPLDKYHGQLLATCAGCCLS